MGYYKEKDILNKEFLLKELQNLQEKEINNVEELIDLIMRKSEISNIVLYNGRIIYIEKCKNINDERAKDEKNIFYENIELPFFKMGKILTEKIKNNRYFMDLPEEYDFFKQILLNELTSNSDEITITNKRIMKLQDKYIEHCETLYDDFLGKKHRYFEFMGYLNSSDRNLRESSWKKQSEILTEHKNKLYELFSEITCERLKLSKLYGYDNFIEFRFRQMKRIGYTPQTIKNLHDSIERELLPVVKHLNETRKNKLELESLRPWDLSVPYKISQEYSFDNVEEIYSKGLKVFDKIDHRFAEIVEDMHENNLMDLESREGKSPGLFCSPLRYINKAFLFMILVGGFEDLLTFIHEAGHGIHHYHYLEKNKISEYTLLPNELTEVGSMTMECLSLDHLDEFFHTENDCKNYKLVYLENALRLILFCVVIDKFQFWIYENPGHSIEEKENYFSELMKKFTPGVNWEGLEEELKVQYHTQGHVYQVPFYYIEYGISQLTALKIYKNYKTYGLKAIDDFTEGMKLGFSKPVHEAYKTIGASFDFTDGYIKEIADFVLQEINALL